MQCHLTGSLISELDRLRIATSLLDAATDARLSALRMPVRLIEVELADICGQLLPRPRDHPHIRVDGRPASD
ncbi:hypothetical protein GTV32_16365 [Gordonia sp. SID5947]|uniref:hypothetical protein n=1 Tax=Gordonia sp. SID5947 TaxID=2690315 RepID=UPI00136B57EF|nr:hypothetical protein [Gordonia sp. SID5947]MYR07777.1 hypothetical protein [Gordonia sp. SID5947]